MMNKILAFTLAAGFFVAAFSASVPNPLIWSDVPDISVVRGEGSNYYMVSTTMHCVPGVPVMHSSDLANWRTVGYAYQKLVDNDMMNLNNGQDAYGNGSWASSIRYHKGKYYVLTPGKTSGKSHVYVTENIEEGDWKEYQLPFYHDPSLFFDDDGSVFIIYGTGTISYVELNSEATAVKAGGRSGRLNLPIEATVGKTGLAEGSHMEKIDGKYYLFMITWPDGGRTEAVFRSSSLAGSYEGKIFLKDRGIAQGSIFDTPDGKWYGYLFKDNGGVGRIPYLMEVEWKDGWPAAKGGKAPETLELANAVTPGYNMVTSDDFDGDVFPLEWQWNHNPDDKNWSRKDGKFRITTGRVDKKVFFAKNTLTMRTFGPKSSGRTLVNGKGMKDGDIAGLVALADSLGFVGLEKTGSGYNVVYYEREFRIKSEVYSGGDDIYLRIDFDFSPSGWAFTDRAKFYYSADGNNWTQIGNELKLPYTLGMFIGYRFGLFNFATKTVGGYAEFDWFKVGKDYKDEIYLDALNEDPIPQTPYQENKIIFTNKVEMEFYDLGGQKNAYYDLDILNQGDANYRADERVDLVLVDENDASKGIALGYTGVGEWLEYTGEFSASANLYIHASVASGADNSSFTVSLDGNLLMTFDVENTGDWQTYKTIISELPVAVTAGEHILRIDITGANVNIDWLQFNEKSTKYEKTLLLNKTNDNMRVYNLQGKYFGTVSGHFLNEDVYRLTKQSGVYLLKNKGGSMKVNIP